MYNESISVMAVFEAVASRGEISRAELSKITGFSLVTVGKAVEELVTCGVIEENKRSSGSVGRKSGVCSVAKDYGMLIFDMTSENHRCRICDLGLNIMHEFEDSTSSIEELYFSGFSSFTEIFGGQILGIGICVRDGMAKKYAESFKACMGQYPELVIEGSRAYAAANAHRLDCDSAAILVRLFENGTTDGAITYKKKLYSGAHGNAGGFVRIINSKEALTSKLFDICRIIDPGTVHIGCQNEADCDIAEKLHDMLVASGISEEQLPEIISEPLTLCRSTFDGTAMLLRERQITHKLSKNS